MQLMIMWFVMLLKRPKKYFDFFLMIWIANEVSDCSVWFGLFPLSNSSYFDSTGFSIWTCSINVFSLFFKNIFIVLCFYLCMSIQSSFRISSSPFLDMWLLLLLWMWKALLIQLSNCFCFVFIINTQKETLF